MINCYLLLLLGFSVAPGDNINNNDWVLEVGRSYEITVRVFDKTNHVMMMGEVSC